MSHLLTLFILPFVASLLMFIMPYISARHLKQIAFALSLAPLAQLLLHHNEWIGANIQYLWFKPLSVEFFLRVDALSLTFLYLTAIIIPMSILSIKSVRFSHPNTFYALILLLQGLLIGFFTSRDIALFTIFWEAMLLPLYFIIAMWGGPQRRSAAMRFIIYMIAGSVLMVAALLFLYLASEKAIGIATFNMDDLASMATKIPHAAWIGTIFFLAFSVKTPLFPFHGWLPSAYCEAPTAGTILLAGLLSKAGIYGFLRVGTEMFPNLMIGWAPIFLALAITGVLYAGLAAYRESDFKRLIAYSSLSHVNFIIAGIFIWNSIAHQGAILQAVNHGLIITALFLVCGWLEDRLGSTSLANTGGLAKFLPTLCWLTLFFTVASVALPGTNSFVGELLIFFGFFKSYGWLTAILGLSIILSVMYMLRFMRKIYFGPPTFFQETWTDIKWKEITIAFPLIALILWIGIYPAPLLEMIKPATENIILETTVQGNKVTLDLDSESLSIEVDHSLTVKATSIESDYGSRDGVNLLSSTVVSRIKPKESPSWSPR